MIETIAVA